MTTTFADVVRLAKTLGDDVVDAVGQGNQPHVSVLVDGKPKGLAWVWLERVHPKKPRVPNPGVIAVRVKDEVEKELLIQGDPAIYFTEPHYNGYAAVLVRLAVVGAPELKRLLAAARATQLAKAKKPRAKKKAKTASRPVRG